MAKSTVTEVPYDKYGSLLHYPKGSFRWRPNDVFHATLRIYETLSGRSAKYFIWTPPDPQLDDLSNPFPTFPMFAAEMVDLLQRSPVIRNGIVSARWIVRKRGANYGIALAPNEQ